MSEPKILFEMGDLTLFVNDEGEVKICTTYGRDVTLDPETAFNLGRALAGAFYKPSAPMKLDPRYFELVKVSNEDPSLITGKSLCICGCTALKHESVGGCGHPCGAFRPPSRGGCGMHYCGGELISQGDNDPPRCSVCG